MIQHPIFKSVPTFRKYEDYHDAENYTKGWNDAMRFIFGENEKDNKHISILKKGRRSNERRMDRDKNQKAD